jgi:multidrug efflux pump subunit AcrA (membrane-fusion protein)
LKTAGYYINVTKICKLILLIAIPVLLVAGTSCAPKTTTPAAATQTATVQRGNLSVNVSVDGNLVMPQAYNLLFGAPGTVQNVYVEEGDVVKEGTVLATLDNTTQKLSVESANNNVQTVLSKMYETVPLLPQFQTVLYQTTLQNSSTSFGPFPDTVSVVTYEPGTPTPAPGSPPEQTTISTNTANSGEPGTSVVTETITTTKTTIDAPITDPDTGVTIQSTHVQVQKVTTNTYTLARTSDHVDTSSAYYYPNSTALSAYNWALAEVSAASTLYNSDNYTGAASELNVALADLEACTAIFQDAINNPKSGLGNIASQVPEDEAGIMQLSIAGGEPWEISYVVQLRKAIDLIQQGQSDISSARDLIDQGKYDEAGTLLNTILKSVNDIGKVVYNNINIIKAHNYSTIYGEDISLYFYGAAKDKLSSALKGIETGGLNSSELYDNLRIADHYMRLCNSILGSNDYVLQHGLSLKNQQQYNVDLQNALVGLGNAQDNFLKTVILAPFDGTVVSVGVKKNDVLSQIDYASVTAVQLVDTSQIKFEGQVDEIDILKIKAGQTASIEVDAVPNKMFPGTVSFISPYGTPNTSGVVEFPITIQLNPSDVALKGGLTSTADISVSSVEDAVLVPVGAVTTTSTGSFVTVVHQATGKQEKREVTLGAQNLQFAQVLSGLREGETVLIQETATKAPVVTGFPGRGGGSSSGGGGGPQGGR